jgi:hypothetical protein
LEASAFIYALIEVLDERGIVTIEELAECKRMVGQRLVEQLRRIGEGVVLQDADGDKYIFQREAQVDCEGRLSICKSICCKFPFALSRQDVEEGIIRSEFGRPYLIALGDDGYCMYLDRDTSCYTDHQHRPVPRRSFDCRNSERWHVRKDYEKIAPNDELNRQFSEGNGRLYHGKERLEGTTAIKTWMESSVHIARQG